MHPEQWKFLNCMPQGQNSKPNKSKVKAVGCKTKKYKTMVFNVNP